MLRFTARKSVRHCSAYSAMLSKDKKLPINVPRALEQSKRRYLLLRYVRYLDLAEHCIEWLSPRVESEAAICRVMARALASQENIVTTLQSPS